MQEFSPAPMPCCQLWNEKIKENNRGETVREKAAGDVMEAI